MDAGSALSYSRSIGDAIEAIRHCPIPVVAMIHGLAVGGGCELASACDIRLADSSAKLGIPITRLGVTLGVAEARALADLVGAGKARYLLVSGRLVDSDEAIRIGLVDIVTGPDDLAAQTEALARSMVASIAGAVTAAKRIVAVASMGADRRYPETFAEELFSVYEGAPLRAGVEAFRARRPEPSGEQEERE